MDATVHDIDDGPREIERVEGRFGELVLRSRDGHHEIISNGVMLMDTRNGASERLLVRRTLEAATGTDRLLLAGLGVGFSLTEAIDRGVPDITVVECEAAVVRWHRTVLGPVTGGAVEHPAVTCVTADVVTWLASSDERFDAICLDVDNGPDWTVGDDNAVLYTAEGLRDLRRHLTPAGALGIWSAHRSPEFEGRLRDVFTGVETASVPVPRGEPDVVYVARTGTSRPQAPVAAPAVASPDRAKTAWIRRPRAR